MAVVDWGGIEKDLKQFLDRTDVRREINDAVSDEMLSSRESSIIEAARKFVEIFRDTVDKSAGENFAGGQLGPTAVAQLKALEIGRPRKTGDTTYEIRIGFVGDLHRPSMLPSVYDGIDDIVLLLDRGYTATEQVYGKWHSDEIRPSLQQRQGAGFIDTAIRRFMSGYARQYGVVDISCQ